MFVCMSTIQEVAASSASRCPCEYSGKACATHQNERIGVELVSLTRSLSTA